MKQLISELAYCLEPANISTPEDRGTVYLSDFSLAHHGQWTRRARIGSKSYTSPGESFHPLQRNRTDVSIESAREADGDTLDLPKGDVVPRHRPLRVSYGRNTIPRGAPQRYDVYKMYSSWTSVFTEYGHLGHARRYFSRGYLNRNPRCE